MERQNTKSHPFFNRLAFSLVAFALALAALQQFRPSRANALPALAAATTPTPTPVPKTDFDIYPLNSSGVVQAKSGGASWPGAAPGYNITRVFKNINNQSYVIMLNGNTGRGRTYALDSDGSLGTATWVTGDSAISDLRCTSAETVKIGTTSYLITHDSLTGKVRTFHLYDNGQPNLGSMGVTTHNDWKDKNLFSLYYYNGSYYLLGADTWTGAAVAYTINGQKISPDGHNWSLGWTSVDHLALGGVTYRLLYKAAGDPHKKNGEANDQLGRFVIQTVNANGVTGQNIYDAPIGADFSSARFAPLHNGQNWQWHIFFFKRDTAHYVARQFDSQNGVGAVTAFGIIKDGPNFNDVAPAYVDIEPYTIGVNTFLATVSDDNSKPFYFAQVEKMGQAIHDGLKNKVVGYQFMLAQSGRVIYSRAYGKRYLSANAGANAAPSGYDMTTRTLNGLASASKMIMTMTALKLADNGVIQNIEQDPIANYLDPAKYPSNQLHDWVRQRPVLNLLTHTSGLVESQAGCDKLPGDKMACYNYFSTEPQLECDEAGKNCKRSYNNYNTNAVRVLIESQTGAETAEQIVNKTRELWADSVGLSSMTCEINSNIHFFAPCNEAANCFDYNGQSWRQSDYEQGWSPSCSAGGWWASSRELLGFMTAIRYRQILSSSHLNDLLVSKTMEDVSGNPTALGWEPAWNAGDETALGKNGGTTDADGFGPRAYITRLPNNCDAVIVTNTTTSNHPQGLLTNSYLYATGENAEPPVPPPVYYDIAVNGKEDSGTISRVAVNAVQTGGSENQHVVAVKDGSGALKLAAFNVSPYDGQVTLKDTATAAIDGVAAIPATELAITDTANFATASLGVDNKLNVISWNYDGANLTQYGMGVGVTAQEVAATKAQGGDSRGRVVTAIRTNSGNLRLDVWEFNNTNNTVMLKDSYNAGPAQEIAIKTLRFRGLLTLTARVVTALRNGGGQLQVDVWDVNSSGQLQRLGTGLFGEVTSTTDSLFKIAIATDADGGDFFNNAGFMTAFINQNGKPQVATWSVSFNGMIVDKRDDDIYNTGVSDLAASASTVTMRRSSDDTLRTVKWKILSDGGIAGYGARDDGLTIKRVSAAANFFTASQLTDDKLRVYNWKITE